MNIVDDDSLGASPEAAGSPNRVDSAVAPTPLLLGNDSDEEESVLSLRKRLLLSLRDLILYFGATRILAILLASVVRAVRLAVWRIPGVSHSPWRTLALELPNMVEFWVVSFLIFTVCAILGANPYPQRLSRLRMDSVLIFGVDIQFVLYSLATPSSQDTASMFVIYCVYDLFMIYLRLVVAYPLSKWLAPPKKRHRAIDTQHASVSTPN